MNPTAVGWGVAAFPLTVLCLSLFLASFALQYTRYLLSSSPQSLLSRSVKKVGWGVLAERPMGVGQRELVNFVAILAGFAAFDCVLITLFAGETTGGYGELWVTQHRVLLWCTGIAACSALNHVSRNVLSWYLSKEHVHTQSANAVRIAVKVGILVGWVASGDFGRVIWVKHAELTPRDFEGTMWVLLGICVLYSWEIFFRELRAVNLVHHLITCIGIFAVFEWWPPEDTTRAFSPIPICGSLIESICCLGTVAYRVMPRGHVLANLMLAEMAFVLVSYNALAVVCFMVYHVNFYALNTITVLSVPVLYLFTYPAQMNMARIFHSLYKKSLLPREIPISTSDAPTSTIRTG